MSNPKARATSLKDDVVEFCQDDAVSVGRLGYFVRRQVGQVLRLPVQQLRRAVADLRA
jgi:hypothetical protein